MKLHDLKTQHTAALDSAEAVITRATATGRQTLNAVEQAQCDMHMAEAKGLETKIRAAESRGGLSAQFGAAGPWGGLMLDGESPAGFSQPVNRVIRMGEARSPEYSAALHSFLKTGGKAHGDELTVGADGTGGYHFPGSEAYTQQRLPNGRASAALYEGTNGGSNGAGGYSVNIPTVQQIVPLAMPDLGIFDASMVIPTATNVKIPQQASFGVSAQKAESTGTIATFGGTDPTLGQVELSAFMAGALRMASYELLQDVEMFQQFLIDDLIKGQRILEGSLLATGNGTTQPQGVFGNTGTGTGAAYALTGASTDGAVLLNAIFDVVATLKGAYQANAAWVMSRSSGLAIRRAQMQANLFVPVVTVDADGTERILGKPVFYDVNAPALPSATTAGVVPILYGDFKAGNLIGVRGGAGINVKILDQPWASQGQIGILAYRRLDSRIRRSEAIQEITFSHS
jgi:HK97 family phage major capsid protein